MCTPLPIPHPTLQKMTSVRSHMIYHTLQHHPECFDFSIDISDHPTCMHFSWLTWEGKRASTDGGHEKQKIHNTSHTVPGALCATIMFSLCSMSSEAVRYSCVCPSTSACPCEDIAFREKGMRDTPLPPRGHRQEGH